MHFEGQNPYSVAEVAYATCNTIGGDYTFQSHFRPMGIDSRDINVYKDNDGKGYLICTTEGNQSVSLFELDDSYTGIVREVFRGHASDDMECEGHAIIKSGGYYFWMMSWRTGWDFNDNHYYATSLAGPWASGGNIATDNTHTYESQVGFALTVVGSETTSFLYQGDRWSVSNYSMSRIVFLPLQVKGTDLELKWHDQWNIDTETGQWFAGSKNFIDGVYTIAAKHSGMVLGTNESSVRQQVYTGSDNQLWRIENRGASHFKITSVESGKVIDISDESREPGAKALQYDWKDSYNQKWHIIDCGNGYHRLVNVNTLGKALEISNSSMSAGTDAVIGNFAFNDNQLWKITAVNDDVISGSTYMIINRTSSKALDIGDGMNQSPIIQTTASKKAEQIWRIEDLLNGYYSITNISNGNAIDNLNSSENLSEVGQKALSEMHAQQWQIVPVEGEYYKLVNRVAGKILDNNDGSMDDGNIMVQYSDYVSSNTNQQWKFVPAESVTGINYKILSNQICCYPRSINGKIIIELGTLKAHKIILYNLKGEAVKSMTSEFSGAQEIKSHDISSGVYILYLKNKNITFTKRMIVECWSY